MWEKRKKRKKVCTIRKRGIEDHKHLSAPPIHRPCRSMSNRVLFPPPHPPFITPRSVTRRQWRSSPQSHSSECFDRFCHPRPAPDSPGDRSWSLLAGLHACVKGHMAKPSPAMRHTPHEPGPNQSESIQPAIIQHVNPDFSRSKEGERRKCSRAWRQRGGRVPQDEPELCREICIYSVRVVVLAPRPPYLKGGWSRGGVVLGPCRSRNLGMSTHANFKFHVEPRKYTAQ